MPNRPRGSLTDPMQQLQHHRVDLGSINVNYVRMGEGPPVVFIHGVNASWYTWCRNLEPVAQAGFTVLALDLPGYGDSDKPRDLAYTPANGVKLVNDFLEALGVERAVIVGNSAGGLLGGLFAITHPSKVERLVLVASAGMGRDVASLLHLAVVPGLGEAIFRTRFFEMLDFHRRAFHKAPDFLEEVLPEFRRVAKLPGARRALLQSIRSSVNLFGQRKEFMLLDRLSQLPAPVLTVWGQEDIVLPASQANEVARLLPRSIVKIFPECGHWPHMEQEATFNQLITKFLHGDLDQDAFSERPNASMPG